MFLDAKSFDLDVWGSKNIQIETFSIQRHELRMLKTLKSRFILNSKLLTSWGMSQDVKTSILRFGDLKKFKLGVIPNRSF